MKVFKKIGKATDKISNVCVDQSAYYRGLSAIKGINLAKYRKEVEAELQSDEDDGENAKKGKGKKPKTKRTLFNLSMPCSLFAV